jgi:hypothetical protein
MLLASQLQRRRASLWSHAFANPGLEHKLHLCYVGRFAGAIPRQHMLKELGGFNCQALYQLLEAH